MMADPATGLPRESVPLQTIKAESQTPPQTLPAGETVAIFVFDELKVKVVVTGVFAAFTATALIGVTWPATREIEFGETETTATLLLFEEEPPPQPASNDKNSPRAAKPARWQRAPFARVVRTNEIRIV